MLILSKYLTLLIYNKYKACGVLRNSASIIKKYAKFNFEAFSPY